MQATGTARRTVTILATLALASCAGDRLVGLPGGTDAPPPAAQQSAPPMDMAGRWLLSQPGRGQCHMNFVAASATAVNGDIKPEGGCPGRLYMSRKWTFEQGQLVIRSHTSQPLAQLSAGGGGKATSGEPLTLMR